MGFDGFFVVLKIFHRFNEFSDVNHSIIIIINTVHDGFYIVNDQHITVFFLEHCSKFGK